MFGRLIPPNAVANLSKLTRVLYVGGRPELPGLSLEHLKGLSQLMGLNLATTRVTDE